MSLYDDGDMGDSDKVAGWASGIKFLQTHVKLKKAALTQPKREQLRKQTTLGPVIDLSKGNPNKETTNSEETGSPERKKDDSTPYILPFISQPQVIKEIKKPKKFSSTYLSVDPEWQIEDEYDPLWPNDYERALKELRERRDKEAEEEEVRRKLAEEKEEEEEIVNSLNNFNKSFSSSSGNNKSGGVAIAPPPSLMTGPSSNSSEQEDKNPSTAGLGGNFIGSGASAAARIMAKYGYKEGQGLGKKEQGMSTALLVEKTSHRTGRIIHEKERGYYEKDTKPATVVIGSQSAALAAYNDDAEFEMEPPELPEQTQNFETSEPQPPAENEPTLAELLKHPSNVVLLKNMVGPGEVDDDLEPEVKDECNTKYGDVGNVTIYQMPDADDENSIRIFVEFKRVESAVKALVDLNGRFFGGRQVKALFYSVDKYNNLELTE